MKSFPPKIFCTRLKIPGLLALIWVSHSFAGDAFQSVGSATPFTLAPATNTTRIGIGFGAAAALGTLDVRPPAASSGAGLPIIFSAQTGATSSAGGNILFNGGANGSGGVNGNILFGVGGVINSTGTGFTTGERMRIDANGRLGIGLTAPLSTVHIRKDDGLVLGEHSIVSVDRNGANNNTDPAFGIGYRVEGSTPATTRVWLGSGNSFPLDFRTSSSQQAMSILNNGSVGIGNPNPSGILDVRSNAATSGAGLPIILSAQTGAASNSGGNFVLNSGANGSGSTNGSILFGVGGTIGPNGTLATGERMRLDPLGRLALGLPTPLSAVHIRRDEGLASGEHSWISLERNGSNLYSSDPSFGIGYRSDGTNPSRVWMGAGNGFPLDFRVTNATQAMTISGTGNVGINNPNPQGTLDVRGGQSSATDGLPIVLSAQGGASTKNGGNIILNSGPNGAGGSNGAIIFATGGVLNSAGTGMAVGERMRIDAAGRLALGNSSPVCAFHLRNDDGVASGEHSWVNYDRNGSGNGTDPVIGFGYRGDGSTNPTRVWMGAGNGFPLDFRVSGAQQAMSISGSGNVGINNPNPGERLDIDGNIKATGSITVASVVTKSWSVTPDYVFEKDYRLASLDDVEKFVDVHKHLPEVPSAKDLAKTGMNLAEMNVVLLKKVEELTLYSIEERKRNQALERRLDRLEQVAAHSDR